MEVSFIAHRVRLDDRACTVVTFDTPGPDYLEFQREHSYDPDEETGEVAPDEPVYVERISQKWADRGGVESCVLGRDSLEVRMSAATAPRLGARVVRVAFTIGDQEYAELRAAMRKVFRGEASYREADAEPAAAPDGPSKPGPPVS